MCHRSGATTTHPHARSRSNSRHWSTSAKCTRMDTSTPKLLCGCGQAHRCRPSAHGRFEQSRSRNADVQRATRAPAVASLHTAAHRVAHLHAHGRVQLAQAAVVTHRVVRRGPVPDAAATGALRCDRWSRGVHTPHLATRTCVTPCERPYEARGCASAATVAAADVPAAAMLCPCAGTCRGDATRIWGTCHTRTPTPSLRPHHAHTHARTRNEHLVRTGGRWRLGAAVGGSARARSTTVVPPPPPQR